MARSNDENNRIINEAAARKQERKDRETADYRQARDATFSGGGGGRGGGAASCFPAGTMVRTPNGCADISTIADGDIVIAVDPLTKEQVPRKVLKAVLPHSSKILTIIFTDGTSVRTTMRHSFFVRGKWKKASDIKVGDEMASFSGCHLDYKRVGSKALGLSAEPVFNLIVEGKFTFVADGVLVHSFSYFRAALGSIWTCYGKVRDTRSSRASSPLGHAY